MEYFRSIVEGIGLAVDGVGVFVIVAGAIVASARYLYCINQDDSYRSYRQELGKVILLGLEFLVAGDIIRTVAVSPNLENVAVLGLIVLIRTFLSMALELELSGRWPWQVRE